MSSSVERIYMTNPLFLYKMILRKKKKLSTGQGEDYTTACLVEYDIKNHFWLSVDFNRQEELDAYPNTIQQIEFIGQLKKLDNNCNATDAGNIESMFALTILRKIKETRRKFFQGCVAVFTFNLIIFRKINKTELILCKIFEFITNSSLVLIKYFTVKNDRNKFKMLQA